jgi:type 1 fimbriae regulatory protein FimB/type 1 fimbriae regulatory protein FimE
LVVAAGLLAPKAKGRQSVFSEQSAKQRYEYLNQAELELLLKTAKETRYGLRDHLGVLLSYRHGLRASELVALEWDQFDLAAGRVDIRRVKRGVGSRHDLSGEEIRQLRKLIRTQTPGTRHLFTSERGGPWAACGFSRMVERIGKAALPGRGVHAHMLRHSCGHHLAAKGIDTRRIQDWLGHADISNTMVYTRLQAVHLRGIWD